jgi:hypothetical protein
MIEGEVGDGGGCKFEFKCTFVRDQSLKVVMAH